jgi:hypothetical protein
MMKKNNTLIVVIVIAAITLLGALLICKSPFSSQRDVESDIRARSQLREMRNGEGPEEGGNGDKRNSEGYDGRNRPPEMGGVMKYPREFYSHRKEYFHF